jgi:hypothetical protein
MDGCPVAIQGASFLSVGDVAALATGGGIISSNVQGPTTFLGPGSFNTKIEGKNVQVLADPMLNNGGPAGSPANAATMGGVLHEPVIAQATQLGVLPEVQHICDVKCKCQAAGSRSEAGQACISDTLYVEDNLSKGLSPIKPEVSYDMNPSDGPPPKPIMWNYPFKYPLAGTRRPDAVIVDNPNAPWRAAPPMSLEPGNIKAVVEVKLGDDPTSGPKFDSQIDAYTEIAGDDKSKVVVMDEESCTCDDDDDGDPVPVPVPVTKKEEDKQEEEDNKPSLVPGLVPVLAVVGIVALAALAIATLPVSAPVIGGAAAAAAAVAVFSSFGSTSPSPGGA